MISRSCTRAMGNLSHHIAAMERHDRDEDNNGDQRGELLGAGCLDDSAE